jgi:dinuclear metal center YbgI/SA1388 family protein
MIEPAELAAYCDELLAASAVTDYSPNGLQALGTRSIRRLITGVTASRALLDAAADAGGDALLVHHGWFWKGDDPRLTGMHGRRVRVLMASGMSLLGYHLPLDMHPELGNNRSLARVLDIPNPRAADAEGLIWLGELDEPMAGEDFATRVEARLRRTAVHIRARRDGTVQRIAWCTGGAQRYIGRAAALGADLYLSGEISEQTTHEAKELGLDYIAAGHHATERYGVQALGEHLAEAFALDHRFIDIDNPA